MVLRTLNYSNSILTTIIEQIIPFTLSRNKCFAYVQKKLY